MEAIATSNKKLLVAKTVQIGVGVLHKTLRGVSLEDHLGNDPLGRRERTKPTAYQHKKLRTGLLAVLLGAIGRYYWARGSPIGPGDLPLKIS